MTNYVSDKAAVKSVSAYVILSPKGKHVATVKAHWGDSTCLVNVHDDLAGFQYARASGGGYDKFTSALSGLTIDGHKMSDHCGERLKKPRKGFFPANCKPRKGWQTANYSTYYREDSGKYTPRHSYDWRDMAQAALGEAAQWEEIKAESLRLEREASESGRLESGYSDCYRLPGLTYLEAIGYRVIQAV